MTNQTILDPEMMKLAEKIKAGSATEEEKSTFFKNLSALLAKINMDLKTLAKKED